MNPATFFGGVAAGAIVMFAAIRIEAYIDRRARAEAATHLFPRLLITYSKGGRS